MTRLLPRLALAIVTLAGCVPAAVAPSSPPVAERVPRDPAVRVGRLPNGLTFYVRENREPKARAELRLVVNAGSVLEEEDQRGLAHLVEHMAFNGTRGFPEHRIRDYLESVGMRFGPDINAYTSFDETVYTLTLPTDSAEVLETGLAVLREWAHEIAFDTAEVRLEKYVVIEEWRLGRGAAGRIRDRQLPELFHGSRYADRLPIGTRESLETATVEALERFYRSWYRPELMAVVAVGDFDADEVEARIRARFSDLPSSGTAPERPRFDVPPHEETRFAIATDPEATGTTVSVYSKHAPLRRGTVEGYRESIVGSLFQTMLGERLSERTHSPDAPFLSASVFEGDLVRGTAAHAISASVREGGVPRALEALLVELRRAALHGFTEAELEREKRSLLRQWEQIHAEREKTHSGQYAAEYVAHFLEGEAIPSADVELELYRSLVPTVTLEEVARLARERARGESRVILVSAPEKPGVTPLDTAELSRAVAAAQRSDPAPHVDGGAERPLLARTPIPGRIVSERTDSASGVFEWRLSNGARLLFRPTDFRDDEVLFSASSPGGLSLAPDSLYVPAMTASGVVQMSGVGDFDLVELGKRLSGAMVGVGPSIGELREGFAGGGSARELETLLQLVHLYFIAPRADSTAFLTYRARARESLRDRRASPEAEFQDSVRLILYQNHPRARPVTAQTFDAMELEPSFRFFRERFANAGDFTFYLVGNIDPERLRPLVERYLASLPGGGEPERWRDTGMRPVRGVVIRDVLRGVEPRARTRILFTGPVQFGRGELAALQLLGDVLELRLREVIREDLGGSYGVGVTAGASAAPVPGYTIGISFAADPARVDTLAAEVMAQIESLRRAGPTPAELRKVKEAARREREVLMRDNSYWLSRLIAFDQNGWALAGLAAGAPEMERLGVERIREAAARYLDAGNHVRVTLRPEQ